MKVDTLTDITLELPKANVVIELPNGQRMATTWYLVSDDKRGDPIVVINGRAPVERDVRLLSLYCYTIMEIA